jgi:lambda family phage tail tape measure protein
MATIENFILRFKTEGTGAINALKDDIRDLTDQVSPLNGALGNLTSRLGLLGGAALAGGLAFAGLGLKASTMADEIQDMAAATGIGAGQLLNLKESLAQAGGDAQSFVGIANKLNMAIGESMGGNEKFQESFRELGISIRDSNGNMRDSGTILEETLQALADIENPTIRAAKAVELLGREASRIDWSNVKAPKDVIGDEQIAQLSKYRGAIDDLAASIETGLVRVFGELAEAYNRGGVFNAMAAGLEQVARGLAKVTPDFLKLQELADKARMERLGNLAGGGRGLGMGGPTAQELADFNSRGNKGDQGGPSKAQLDKQKADREKAAKEAADLELRIFRSTEATKRDTALQFATDDEQIAEIRAQSQIREAQRTITNARELAAKRVEIETARDLEISKIQARAQEKAAAEEKRLTDRRLAEIERLNTAAQTEIARYGGQTALLRDQLQLQQELVGLSTIEGDRRTKIAEASRDQAAMLASLVGITDNDMRLKREQEINDAHKERIALINEEADVRAKRDQDFSAGIRETMKRYSESMTPLKQGAAMAESVYGNMGRSLDNFVDTGKFKFSDFANSVIMDLLKIQLRSQATQLFNSVLGTFGFSLPGRAAGGPVTAGQPYIVGEQGPEVFLPTSSGTIIPNNRLGSNGGGGAATSVVYNIQAVDAPSFRQLVARDPGFIYAVTEQGRKTIPTTRR